MDLFGILNQETLNFWILPLLIFIARVCDVTIQTLRIIYVSRGMKYIATILGFIEVFIWLLAITEIFKNLTSPIHYIAYSAGFGMGNFIGIIIEEKLSVGTVLIRVITKRDSQILRERLREEGFGVTTHEACGEHGPVGIIFTVVKRKKLKEVLAMIREYNPRAVYSIEDIRSISGTTHIPHDDENYLKPLRIIETRGYMHRLRKMRKTK